EQVEHDHPRERRAERQQSRVADKHVGDGQHGQADAEVTEVDAEHDGGGTLQEEQHAARREQLVDRCRTQEWGDHQQMQYDAQYTDAGDADRRSDQKRHAVDFEQEEHAVHAEHDQFGIADPYDVDHAEDQVQPKCQQGQHAAQQNAVDQRLKQIDIEYIE